MAGILFVQTELKPVGGANGVAAWMLQALAAEHEITLLTYEPAEIANVNLCWGTHIDESALELRNFSRLTTTLVNLDPDAWSFQPLALLMRRCQHMAADFDLCISASDEVDFGRRGIMYVHYPYLARHARRPQPQAGEPWRQQWWQALRGHYRPWQVISGFSFERMRQNLALVNSAWTADLFQQEYGVVPTVLYPPATGTPSSVPWAERQPGFVCIGRLAHEKHHERMIDILRRVRAEFAAVRLHIVGAPYLIDRRAHAYYRRLLSLVQANADWVHLHERISRAELNHLLAHQRFGIHAHPQEHFGMAVAEMVRAGCIVFVPGDGGQVEIVGHEPRLMYDSEDDAVAKILHVLRQPAEQEALRRRLASRQHLFSPEHFCARLQDIVKEFLAAREGRGRA